MEQNKLVIGLFGFGVVGEGIYQVLLQTPTLQATIKKVCIKNAAKQRNIDARLLTTDRAELLNDPEINVIVELINDADEAFKIVTTALQHKKTVVSANKKMIAEHFTELLALQKEHGVALLYEGAVCGSVPIIRNLEEYFDNDLLQQLSGIVNGSTNYILTKIDRDHLSYEAALQQAQALGFAETDPSLDVEGIDAVNKLSILLVHAYGIIAPPQQLLHAGINRLRPEDVAFAKKNGYRIKLVAQSRKLSNGEVAAFVWPQFVTEQSSLYAVADEYNGVVVESKLADKQFLSGKGAGRFPTASAVTSDISALRYHYQYEYKKLHAPQVSNLASDFYLRVWISRESFSKNQLKDLELMEDYQTNAVSETVIGLIHAEKLREGWLQEKDTSVVLLPDAIVESKPVTALNKQKDWLKAPVVL